MATLNPLERWWWKRNHLPRRGEELDVTFEGWTGTMETTVRVTRVRLARDGSFEIHFIGPEVGNGKIMGGPE